MDCITVTGDWSVQPVSTQADWYRQAERHSLRQAPTSNFWFYLFFCSPVSRPCSLFLACCVVSSTCPIPNIALLIHLWGRADIRDLCYKVRLLLTTAGSNNYLFGPLSNSCKMAHVTLTSSQWQKAPVWTSNAEQETCFWQKQSHDIIDIISCITDLLSVMQER